KERYPRDPGEEQQRGAVCSGLLAGRLDGSRATAAKQAHAELLKGCQGPAQAMLERMVRKQLREQVVANAQVGSSASDDAAPSSAVVATRAPGSVPECLLLAARM